jgi:uncharacterized protein (TIGR03437 family)
MVAMRCLVLLLSLASTAWASAMSVAPYQTLVIRFSGPSPSCLPAPCTTIRVDFGNLTSSIPAPNFSTLSQIFNGNTLLGSEVGQGVSAYFVSPLSRFPNPSIQIDFTSINNGTIDGRFEITAGSQYTIQDASALKIIVGTDTSTGGQMRIQSTGTVTASISAISPASVTAGDPGFTIAVTGSHFVPGDQVYVNDFPVPTTYISATGLQGSVPASFLRFPGQITVTVRDAGNNSSGAILLTIVPAPSIVSVSPQAADAGSAGFTFAVVGSNFVAGCTVRAGGNVLSTALVSASQLTAYLPASLLATSGRLSVVVATPDGVVSNEGAFIIVPVLTSVGNVQVSGNQVTVDAIGKGFVGADSVVLTANGMQMKMPTSLIGPGWLRATVTSSALLAGSGMMNVAAPDGADSRFLPFTFPFAISSFSPGGVMAGAQSFTLVISGGIFPPGTLALWNGAPLATTVASLTQLTANVPASLVTSPGTVRVQVLHPNGATSEAPFPINNGLTITSFSPKNAVAGAPGFSLTMNGGGFVSGAAIEWNGVSLPTTFISSTQLVASVPANLIEAAGTAGIVATNPGGGLSNALPYSIVAPTAVPGISSVTPSGAIAGSSSVVVTVSGNGFTSDSTVLFNGAALATSFLSPSQLTATVPADMIASAGAANISVRAGSVTSDPAGFAILSGPPVTSAAAIVNLGNSTVGMAPGSLISIYGSGLAAGVASAAGTPLPNLLGGVSVEVNGIPAPLLYVSPTQINAQIPYEAPAGAATLVVDVGGAARAGVVIQLSRVSPGVWTRAGSSYALAINNDDGSVGTPLTPGTYATVYLTGQGALSQLIPTGGAAPVSPLVSPAGSVQVTVGGVAVTNVASAMAPYLVGVLQVNFQVPNVPPGDQRVVIFVGGAPSNETLLPIAAR